MRGGTTLAAQLITCILTLSVAMQSARAGSVVDPEMPAHVLAAAGLDALFAEDHVGAESLLSRAVRLDPGDPIAPLLRMKLVWWRILQGRDDGQLDRDFEAAFAAVRAVCEPRLKRDDRDVVALYALGEAHCTSGRLHGVHGNGWSTLREHQRGVPLLERALAVQPDLAEPLASLGVYHYYAARAPGFLRFLARFVSVNGDRGRGMDELRRAAASPGLQRPEAAFFLLEILTNVEDELLEALPLALRIHHEYPQNIGFRIALASVQIGLHAPSAGIQLLEEAMDAADASTAVTARFFLARALGMAGRPADSAALLERFSQHDFGRVTWLRAWHPYYLGVAYDQLGRRADARAAYREAVAAEQVADSHGFAKRALERRPGTLLSRAQAVESVLAWDGDASAVLPPLREALASDHGADAETRRRAALALGLVELQLGNQSVAADLFTRASADAGVDEAWLMVRPRIRQLQAMLWAGRFDAAQRAALEYGSQAGEWGSNKQLELLVAVCVAPDAGAVGFATQLEARSGDTVERFELRDAGFTAVALERRGGRAPLLHPMRRSASTWWVEIPLPAGSTEYRFVLEGVQPLPDPANRCIVDAGDGLWSTRIVAAATGS